MRLQLLSAALLVLVPTLAFSQADVTAESPGQLTQMKAIDSAQRLISLSGKVASEEGSTLPDRATVILQCGNDERARTATDRKGTFSMTLALSNDGAGRPSSVSASNQGWNDCELHAETPGYISQHVRIFGPQGIGVVQVGTIMLHPLQKADGFAVSVTSLQAPDKAKRNFEKGREQERKGKWAAACDYFKKAVQAYPRYALAWVELGRTQVKQNDFASAQQSFQQATVQDPRLIDAYVQMANLALQKQQWKELADATAQVVQLSPDASAQFWFLNSAANYNLGNIAEAETSATRGLRLDPNHQVPQLEYLYGVILAHRGEVNPAIEHIQTFIRLAPRSSDVSEAQKKIQELQKMASEKLASR